MRFTVKNREISPSNGTPVFVIGDNADYKVQFDFDSEWNGVVKTARFVRGKKFQEMVLVNDECEIPIEVLKQGFLEVGVFSAEMTTTPCRILVKGSIKELGGMTSEPTPDVYRQIIKMIEDLEVVGVTDAQIEKAVREYLEENPVTGVDESEVQRIVAEYVEANKEDLKGEKGDKGDTGASGKDGVDGVDGTNGVDGKSAYDIAVDNGFEGTEAEWLESLKFTSCVTGEQIENAVDAYLNRSYSHLYGKQYVALGDSIVDYQGTSANPKTYNGKTVKGYIQEIESRYGLVCKNNGHGGHTITQDIDELLSIDYTNAELVTIAYGVNDARTDVVLGEKTSDDKTTFAGALNILLGNIYTQNPCCRVVVLTPIQRLLVNNFGSFTANTNGDTLEDFANMCVDVARLNGTQSIDLFHNCGLNQYNLATLTREGVHPLDNGYSKMYATMNKVIESILSIQFSIQDETETVVSKTINCSELTWAIGYIDNNGKFNTNGEGYTSSNLSTTGYTTLKINSIFDINYRIAEYASDGTFIHRNIDVAPREKYTLCTETAYVRLTFSFTKENDKNDVSITLA